MKIKKRTAYIGFRVEPEFKQNVLKYAFDNNMTLTELFELAFYKLKLEENANLDEEFKGLQLSIFLDKHLK